MPILVITTPEIIFKPVEVNDLEELSIGGTVTFSGVYLGPTLRKRMEESITDCE